ncbi:MAG TPA: serine/threonine-protein kinase [Polyangia bacterium]|nr:serine/threonine-protein kinase [Polyangia bacterium]
MDPQPGSGPIPGTVLDGRYRIEAPIGSGGMGAVYLARQIAVDRAVAVKILRPEAADFPGAAARFREEMHVTSRIEHPNTIRVYDFGESAGRLFLVMEYLPGRTLRAVIDGEGRQPVARALHIGRQVARGLGAAHEAEVVHRDLKPDNVMLVDFFGEGDFVKVMDFGIARSMDALRPQLTMTGQVIGSPAYMAPEQATGDTPDHRTDVYALGIIFYELLTGRVPFQRPTAMSMLMAHVQEPPPPLENWAPDLDPRVTALVMRMLAKSRADRPQSAAEIVAAIEAFGDEAGLRLEDGAAGASRLGVPVFRGAGPGSEPLSGGTALLPESQSGRTAILPESRAGGTALASPVPAARADSHAAPVVPAYGHAAPVVGADSRPAPIAPAPAPAPAPASAARSLGTWRWVKPLLFLALLAMAVIGGGVALFVRLIGKH